MIRELLPVCRSHECLRVRVGHGHCYGFVCRRSFRLALWRARPDCTPIHPFVNPPPQVGRAVQAHGLSTEIFVCDRPGTSPRLNQGCVARCRKAARPSNGHLRPGKRSRGLAPPERGRKTDAARVVSMLQERVVVTSFSRVFRCVSVGVGFPRRAFRLQAGRALPPAAADLLSHKASRA